MKASDKVIELQQNLRFWSREELFTVEELDLFVKSGLPYEYLQTESIRRGSYRMVESYGGGSYSMHSYCNGAVRIDGKWRKVFKGGYIKHQGREYNVSNCNRALKDWNK